MSREHILFIALLIGFAGYNIEAFGNSTHPEDPFSPDIILIQPQDTIPYEERFGDYMNNPSTNPFDLKDPKIIDKDVEYDPATGKYIITEKIGENYFRPPTYMTFKEYLDYRAEKQQETYFKQLSGVSSGERGSSGRIDPIAKVDVKSSLVDRLFGGTEVDIRPQGNIDLTFGWEFSNTQNPGFTQRQQRQGGFNFDMQIQMNVQGNIGQKLKLQTNYNTQATFDFDNTMKLDYSTDGFNDDDIIKKIEAGNVSLPLRGTLIQGSQSLFGVKTELQFGRLRLTAVASQQKSDRQEITLQGGSQFQTFEVRADEYDENRHFFLTHYNRDHFEEALKELPQVKTLFKIQRIQVWITDTRNATEDIRDIVAIADLGEPRRVTNKTPEFQPPAFPRYRDLDGDALPDNFANPIYNELVSDPRTKFVDKAVNVLKTPPFSFQQPRDFEKVSARMLSGTEFDYHPNLGFISLNINVQPDQVVGVAFEYAYRDTVYQVGQLAEDVSQSSDTINQNVLFVKMLKSTTQRVDLPTWDLMMKNVYSIGAFQVAEDEFKLDIFYDDPGEGRKRFLPESNLAGIPLLQVFNLDNLNTQRDPQPDGVFDFVPGLTINTRNGRIMFPRLEPFGSALAQQFTDPADSAKFVYSRLYNSTITTAREFAEFNRFTIEGSFKSNVTADISLGAFNIPPGSVRVTAGGQTLIEGRDYEVDYNIGRLKILNDAVLSSGQPIRVSFEDNTLFGFQTKTMLGLRADYEVNKNLTVGATLLKLFERPYTQKVNIGDDPINNTIYGLDVNYSAEAPWLTKLVDKIPLIDTKEPSSITFSAEAAALRPGHSKAINESGDGQTEGGGVIYIDDFEGSVSSLDMKTPFIGTNGWVLASIPQNDGQNNNPLFPESKFIDTTLSGVNRAMVNWYRLDPSLRDANENNPYTLIIQQQEVFRNFTPTNQLSSFIPILDVRFLPEERGPYNFDLPEGTPYSAGIDSQGKLRDPETRWGGIMRSLNTNDFEAANIEFIEFWVMSPYLNEDGEGGGNPFASNGSMDGDIYFELGNISEDVMHDSRKFFENGLPGPNLVGRRTVQTGWGRVPLSLQITNAFDIDPENRIAQDVGLDGLSDEGEREKFSSWLSAMQAGITPVVFDSIMQDPSNDDFIHFRDERLKDADIFTRYSRFFGTEGNSPPQTGSLTTSSTTLPDSEDLDRDRTLNETESYFQYRVPIQFDGDRGIDLDAAGRFITDTIQSTDNRRIWYRFRIPLNQVDGSENFKRVGGIQDFRSIRFMRMYFKGFQRKVNFRFATLELVRNQWRRYRQSLGDRCVSFEPDDVASNGNFDVNAVNIEENSTRRPFGYILPPGIVREQALGVNLQALQNEQALSMGVCGLEDGDAKAIYKIVNMDMRVFKRMKMFVHAEPRECGMGPEDIEDGKLTVFIRLGSDFKNNYYEYELPLTISRNEALAYNDPDYPREVWRRTNDFDINFETLKKLKLMRNNTQNVSVGDVFPEGGLPDPDTTKKGAKLRIRGNPNLGLVKTVMIGIRNPKEGETCDPNDEQSVEIWVNELRVFGLDERGGVAATAKLDLQLADFGTLSMSTRVSSIGFGAIDQQLAQRAKDEHINYDIATSLELGKFFPKNSGLRIPFYFQWSKEISNPQYDPYDLDIELKDKLKNSDPAIRDSLRNQAQTVTTIKSVNFTNVRKERTRPNKKPMPWDIANFSLSYAFDQTESHDPIIEKDKITRQRGALDYQYSRKVKYIEPFKKTFKKDKFLKLITGINFNLLPNSFSFSTQLDRRFNSTKYRFAGENPIFNTFYNKQFLWDRNYDLQWDLSRNLKFRFFADNSAVIDEPDEKQLLQRHALDAGDPLFIDNIKKYRRDSIWGNILRGGRTKSYNHRASLNYTLPFKQIPFFDWVNVRASYEGSYWWEAASLSPGANSLGNIIRNQQTREVRGDFDFEKIYNYSKYLKQINSKPRPNRNNRGRGSTGKAKAPSDGGKDTGKENKDNKKGKKDKKDKKDKKKDKVPSKTERAVIRPFLILRKLNITFNEDFQTVVPGYLPGSGILGLSNFSSPGWGFIAGFQPNIKQEDYFTSKDWLFKHYDRISGDLLQNRDVEQRHTQRYSIKLRLEPIRDFKVDVEWNRNKTNDHTERFARDSIFVPGQRFQEEFKHFVPRDFGSYKISFTSIKTFFNNDIIGLFDKFEANRVIIANRLSNAGPGTHDNPDDAAALFPEGYGRFQQNVLVPAFLAAYTGKDPATVKIDQDYTKNVLLKTLPKPNWRVTYSGLSKLPMFKEIFQSIDISHGYSGSLTVNNFQSDLQFDQNQPLKKDPIKLDFFSRFEIPNIVIQEQFNPLVGISMRMQNGMDLRMDFKKARDLRMSFQDFSLNESKTKDLTIGFGYKLKNVQLDFLSAKKKKGRGRGKDNPPPDNNRRPGGRRRSSSQGKPGDLDISFDLSIRDDITIRHELDRDQQEPTRGNRTVSILPAAEFRVNQQLSLRFFFDYRRTVPKTSQGFPRTDISSGITVRFSLN